MVRTEATQSALTQAQGLVQQGRFEDALTTIDSKLEENDAPQPMLWIAAICHMQIRSFDRALSILERMLERDPNAAQILNFKGVALAELYRRDEAQAALEAAHGLKPDDPDITENLGVMYGENGYVNECFHTLLSLTHVRHLKKKSILHLIQCALLIGEQQIAADAAALLKGVKDDPKVDYLLNRLAQNTGNIDDAQNILDDMLTKFPGNADALSDKGILAMSAGRQDEAKRYFNASIETEPGHTTSHFLLAHMGGSGEKELSEETIADRERRLELIKSALEDPTLKHFDKIELNFAAGKLLDSLKQYDACFPYYVEGNALLSARTSFHIEETQTMFDDIKRTFDASFFRNVWPRLTIGRKTRGERMIYVVGMARSGTTLTEQILGRHPMIDPGGETTDVIRLGRLLGDRHGYSTTYLEFLDKMDASAIDAVAEEYVSGIEKRIGADGYRTDKDLRNFVHVALVKTLFPDAKIIHVRRNPIDTCVSCFFQFFKIYKHQYSTNLGDLGAYYRFYDELMSHWNETVPDDILTIRYEELVADQQAVTARMLEHCGLPWDDACLEAQDSGSVRTASVWQVRQKLYTDSQERWRRYEKHLGPLIDALGDLAQTSPAD